MRVLLVEPDKRLGDLYTDFLHDLAHEAVLATTIDLAYHELEVRVPDVVMLDVDPAERTGFIFLESPRVRRSGVPVIAISGTTTERAALRCLRLGAVDFLAKPVPFDRLRSLLAYLEDQAVPGDGARRRVPRLAAPITLRLAYEVEWAAIDLSPFGVKVPLQAWLQPGATVSLTFPLPDGRAPLRLQAVLVRTDPDGHLLSFVNLSDADFRRLVDFCRGVTSDGEAMFRLGLAFEFGKGLARDPGAAVRWYRRAASQGYERAAQRLRALGHDAEAEG